jgi:hypothetical protein
MQKLRYKITIIILIEIQNQKSHINTIRFLLFLQKKYRNASANFSVFHRNNYFIFFL